VLEKVGREGLSATRIDEILEQPQKHKAVVLLTSTLSSRDALRALEGLRTANSQCLQMHTSGSLVDRLVYALIPKPNPRRRPTWYLVCERV
jgi:hypothetical protein